MITKFKKLNKSKKDDILPVLFDIYHGNMSRICPSVKPYDVEREEWISEVSPALDKNPRQIILMYQNDDLAGFFMYYTRGDLLMVEELQLKEKYQRTLLLHRLFTYLTEILSSGCSRIEAYANEENYRSLSLMKYLGFNIVDKNERRKLFHLRAASVDIIPKVKTKNSL